VALSDGRRRGPERRPRAAVGRADWSPAAGLVGLVWAGTAGAGAWLGVLVTGSADPGGLMFAAVSAAGLGLAALFGTRARPRLRADADGLTVRGLLGSRHHPWPLVRDVRVRRVRRLGRETSLLEVDASGADGAERLAMFGRLDLNADPEDVAERIRELRPRRSDLR